MSQMHSPYASRMLHQGPHITTGRELSSQFHAVSRNFQSHCSPIPVICDTPSFEPTNVPLLLNTLPKIQNLPIFTTPL